MSELCPPVSGHQRHGWRDVIDVVRTLVITLSVCVRRFVCTNDACGQRTFDERFEGIGRGGASERALGFFADLARGRATAAVARDLGVPDHYLRLAVGRARARATAPRRRRLGRRLAIDECAVRKPFVFATIFSDPERGVVVDVAPGRDGAAIWAFAGLYSRHERAGVKVVSMDCHNPYRHMVRLVFPHALIVADAFHVHRRFLDALTEVRKAAARRIARRHGRNAWRVPKAARYALLRARDNLEADTSERAARQRAVVAEVCALDDELAVAYELKEAFRTVMAFGRAGDVATFCAGLDLFAALCHSSKITPFKTAAGLLRRWRTEIINYAQHRRRLQRLGRSRQPPHQKPETPSPRLPHLGRLPSPDHLVLRRSHQPRNRRDPPPTPTPTRPGSQLAPTPIRVDPKKKASDLHLFRGRGGT